jgi:hypothetical protein
MGKTRPSFESGSDNEPYEATYFAEKHGLSLKAAKVVLYSNGPSRTMCDAAARAFVEALAARRNGTGLVVRERQA